MGNNALRTDTMTALPTQDALIIPVPIYRVAYHYYLYDAPTIARIRASHHILGNAIGTLPQANQQNIFSGLPLLLMPEEARLLCERHLAFIVDDVRAHRIGYEELEETESGRRRRKLFASRLEAIGRCISESISEEKAKGREVAMSKIGEKELQKRAKRAEEKKKQNAAAAAQKEDGDAPVEPNPMSPTVEQQLSPTEWSYDPSRPVVERHSITPTTSNPPFRLPSPPRNPTLPQAPASYPLYRYLHDRDYFLHPGLRFGCQYMAYPGDPMRFHSHFLVVSREWHEEVNLSTLIGCGRLGTGVKKGFLIGGVERKGPGDQRDQVDDENVRCFSIEWGGI